jgi:flagellar P-ring protein precursor FlgI
MQRSFLQKSKGRQLRRLGRAVLAMAVALAAVPQAHAERLKDLATLVGARNNQLLGYGLVMGLPNTGDDSFSGVAQQSVATMLRHLGVNIDAQQLLMRNVAVVMVTADLPAFVAPGQRLDVTVSSMGNARSLEGGTLVASPLKGSDLRVYAVAQGPLSVGGFYAGGLSGSRTQKNITTVGRIPNGAVVEREVPMVMPQGQLSISLHAPDFTTAVRVASAIDAKLRAAAPAAAGQAAAGQPAADPNQNPAATAFAAARDSGTIVVQIPPAYAGKVAALMADLEVLDVNPDIPNRVVVNERTGTVVLGNAVRLTAVAIAHGGLTLEVRETPQVSQPSAFARGRTVVTPQTQIGASETYKPLQELSAGASLGDVVKALNTLGVAPRDLVAILQALKSAGALRADLEIQ